MAESLSVEDFRMEVQRQIDEARNMGVDYVEIVSGEVHRILGGYPGPNHSMPSCCKAMYDYKKSNDMILAAPSKGKGASLKIRYYI
ncbi:HNH endonuclease [Paenibacillus sp. PK3_47]|uniref:hypothetical protein n=1 Tax=Paenibacillus sp. PK3_47 TaxID=2072642 RepID=UPI00201DA16D|nr:hypothetical protein [Paenibacillus sp. PK3_47]UQZ34621.1 HNH endonuclease [Paenibacillus sp. PK3_47]